MPSALQMRPVDYLVFTIAIPGRPIENAGVILVDREKNQLYAKVRRDADSFQSEEADVLVGLEAAVESATATFESASKALTFISGLFDGLLRATDIQTTMAADPEARLRRLYREHVNTVGAIPVIQLQAAAGYLSDEAEVPGEPIGSVDPPSGTRPSRGMFAAQVVGRSMEPLIPDGSLCLFRPPAGGSRDGKKLLIEKLGSFDSTSQFTVKVYKSEKRVHEDGSWEHQQIRMIPLNPEFEEWNLSPEEFKVIGEFVSVLPSEE